MKIATQELVNSSQKSVVEFVDYTGEFPNLCRGTLIINVNGKRFELSRILRPGGSVWVDNGDERVEDGPWKLYSLPDELKHLHDEIESLVNENVMWGCCGGCI